VRTGDADLWADVQPESRRRILVAAVELFATEGYHPTTTRKIAQVVGMSPAAVYVHYQAKVELLCEIGAVGYSALIAEVRAASEDSSGPADQLARMMSAFVRWQIGHRALARVMQSALDELEDPTRQRILTLQAALGGLFESVLAAGARAGELSVDADVVIPAARALQSIGFDLPRWPWSDDDDARVGHAYAGLALRMLGDARAT
jgi:AcrR family transcriptional regulator